jgi:hypothetical protein
MFWHIFRTQEREVSRKPLRREGRIASAEPVCSCASFFVHLAHETAGAARTRSSLRPPFSRRAERLPKTSRKTCGEIAKPCPANEDTTTLVMPGLDPGIHHSSQEHVWKRMGARIRSGHDSRECCRRYSTNSSRLYPCAYRSAVRSPWSMRAAAAAATAGLA